MNKSKAFDRVMFIIACIALGYFCFAVVESSASEIEDWTYQETIVNSAACTAVNAAAFGLMETDSFLKEGAFWLTFTRSFLDDEAQADALVAVGLEAIKTSLDNGSATKAEVFGAAFDCAEYRKQLMELTEKEE